MSSVRRCWCGSEDLTSFDRQYLSCGSCETLIAAEPESYSDGWAQRGYGRSYWFDHQEKNQRPNLIERSSLDLPERCLHWLRTVLGYKVPPGRSLELGCGHGGFVAMLSWAGFEATGVEMDPWVVDFAHETFGVPVLRGPLEALELEPGSFDLIVAIDVVEHLSDPLRTLGRCFDLLRPDGVLVVQMPCRPSAMSRDDLSAKGHSFVEMLLPDEHLFLFSEQGARALLQRLGADHVSFEPAIFGHYDMFFVAGRQPLQRRTPHEVAARLRTSPEGRAVLAMLDLDAERRERLRLQEERESQLQNQASELEAASRELAGREAELQSRRTELEDLNRQRQEREAELRNQVSQLEAATRELAERETELQGRCAELEDLNRQQQERAAELENQVAHLEAATRELAGRETELQSRCAELEDLNRQQQERAVELENQVDHLGATNRELAERETELQGRYTELEELHRQQRERQRQLQSRHDRLNDRHGALRRLVEILRTSKIYGALVWVGRWRVLERELREALKQPREEALLPDPSVRDPASKDR